MFVLCLKSLKVIIAPVSCLPNTGKVPGIPLNVRNVFAFGSLFVQTRSSITTIKEIGSYPNHANICCKIVSCGLKVYYYHDHMFHGVYFCMSLLLATGRNEMPCTSLASVSVKEQPAAKIKHCDFVSLIRNHSAMI